MNVAKKKAQKGQNSESRESIKVFIRIRPLLDTEFGSEICVQTLDDKTCRINNGNLTHEGTFDKVYIQNTPQAEIFEGIESNLEAILAGYNSTVFAYGQTGSGKTYTMFGSHWESNHPQFKRPQVDVRGFPSMADFNSYGIVPRAIQNVFDMILEREYDNEAGPRYSVYCSFLQIYNENLFDLLRNTTSQLRIREDPTFGIFVENLTEYVVQNPSECVALLRKGERNRAARSTRGNQFSSRSHTIFQILVEANKADESGLLSRGKLNLCDLAGSEKWHKGENMGPKHLSEMKSINLSLTTLGKVISTLGKKKQDHVPYRDSKLTRLLKDSLGGNTKTCLIATITPTILCADESIGTLKFAERASHVTSKVKANTISSTDDHLVQKLQREIAHLKEILRMGRTGLSGIELVQQQLLALKEENLQLREKKLSSQEVERLMNENRKLKIQLQSIKADGASTIHGGNDSPRSMTGLDASITRFENESVSDAKSLYYKQTPKADLARETSFSSSTAANSTDYSPTRRTKRGSSMTQQEAMESLGMSPTSPVKTLTKAQSQKSLAPQDGGASPTKKGHRYQLTESNMKKMEASNAFSIRTSSRGNYGETDSRRGMGNTGFSNSSAGGTSSGSRRKRNTLSQSGYSIVGASGSSPVRRGHMRMGTYGTPHDEYLPNMKMTTDSLSNDRTKEMRRAQERLNYLERLERSRADKASMEIERLKEQRRLEDQKKSMKREEAAERRRRVEVQKKKMEKLKVTRSEREQEEEEFKSNLSKFATAEQQQKLLEQKRKLSQLQKQKRVLETQIHGGGGGV